MAIKIIKINDPENLQKLVKTLKNNQPKKRKAKTMRRKKNKNNNNSNMTVGNLINGKIRNNKVHNHNNNNVTVGNMINRKNMGQLNTINNNQQNLKTYPGMSERNASQYRNHVKQVLGGITNAKVNKKTKSTNFANIINRISNNKRNKTRKLSAGLLLGNVINVNQPNNNAYSQVHHTHYQTNVANGKKTKKGVSVYTNTRLPYNVVYEMNNNKITKKLVHKKHMLKQ